jgi:hypothetical protein
MIICKRIVISALQSICAAETEVVPRSTGRLTAGNLPCNGIKNEKGLWIISSGMAGDHFFKRYQDLVSGFFRSLLPDIMF